MYSIESKEIHTFLKFHGFHYIKGRILVGAGAYRLAQRPTLNLVCCSVSSISKFIRQVSLIPSLLVVLGFCRNVLA